MFLGPRQKRDHLGLPEIKLISFQIVQHAAGIKQIVNRLRKRQGIDLGADLSQICCPGLLIG